MRRFSLFLACAVVLGLLSSGFSGFANSSGLSAWWRASAGSPAGAVRLRGLPARASTAGPTAMSASEAPAR
jgi:hypothetical protein